jgi:hypothetical protein
MVVLENVLPAVDRIFGLFNFFFQRPRVFHSESPNLTCSMSQPLKKSVTNMIYVDRIEQIMHTCFEQIRNNKNLRASTLKYTSTCVRHLDTMSVGKGA